MSLAWMHRVWSSDEPAEASDRLLLLALADTANDAGVCWPSVPTLARRCAVRKRALLDTLARLERAGHIERVRTPGKHNVYRLRVVHTGAVDRTGAVDDTGAVHDTGTGAVDDTGSGAVDCTGVVQPTAPEPSRTVSGTHNRTSRTRGGRGGTTALGALLPTGDGATDGADAAAVVGMNGRGVEPSGGATPSEADVAVAAALLTARGVDAAPALRLVRAHGVARVRAVVRAFDGGKGKSAGWIVSALERGYDVALRYETRVGVATPGLPASVSTGGAEQMTHAEMLDTLRARGIVLDEHHPLTDYVEIVRTADGARFVLKPEVP